MPRILGIGDNTIDTYVSAGLQLPGGNAVNVAALARRLGAEASYLGCWGDDVGTLYVGSPDITRDANKPNPNYMRNPKDVRIDELEARLAKLGALGDEKQ